MTDLSWRGEAKCRGIDPNHFFDYSPANVQAVRQTCIGCPVFEECLRWCTDEIEIDDIPEGIIAGYTPNQRMRIASHMHVPDWRENFKRHPACSQCDDIMVTSGGYWICKNCGYRWAKPRVYGPRKYVRKDPSEIDAREAARLEAKNVPACPTCDSKKDIVKRRRADGTMSYKHLPCGESFTEQEEAA